MKIRGMLLVCLIGFGVLFLSHGYSSAQPGGVTSKIGVVDVERVISQSKATALFREELAADSKKYTAEQENLALEVQVLYNTLNSGALVTGSSDHLAQLKEYYEKQRILESLGDFNSNQMSLKQQHWTQEIYQQIMAITSEVAQERELDIVLGTEELQFPYAIYEELMTTLATHKVLYSGGCEDLTDEVLSRLNAKTEEAEAENQ